MIWKFLSVLLASTVKTLLAPAIGFAASMSFGMTFIATAIGGIIGFIVFYHLFGVGLSFFNKKKKYRLTAKQVRKARNIINFKKKYPVWLFVMISPIMSTPIMAIIIRRFFNHNRGIFTLSLVAVTLFALAGCLIFSPIQYL